MAGLIYGGNECYGYLQVLLVHGAAGVDMLAIVCQVGGDVIDHASWDRTWQVGWGYFLFVTWTRVGGMGLSGTDKYG